MLFLPPNQQRESTECRFLWKLAINCCEDVARDSYDEDEDEAEEAEEETEAAMEPSRDRDVLIEKYHVRPWLHV